MTISIKANRAYPSLPAVTGDPRSHTRVLEAIREAVEIHERRVPNAYLDSFVRLRELIELGIVQVRGNQIVLSLDTSGGGGAVEADDVSYDNDSSGLMATDVQAALDELAALLGQTQPWTPAELSPQAWLDASDPASIVLDSGAVSQWSDKSGNGNHATQGTAANRPIVSVSAVAGKNALLFDGSNDFLEFASPLLSTTFSLFAVFRSTVEATTGSLLSQYAVAQAGRTIVSTNQNDAGLTAAGRLNPFNSSITNGAGGSGLLDDMAMPSTVFLFEWISNTASEGCKVYSFGTLTDSGTLSAMYTGANTLIGARPGPIDPFDGVICELVLLNRVATESERLQTEGYLAHKWNFFPALPLGHPYLSAPPHL